MAIKPILAVLAFALLLIGPSCELVYLPPATWFFFPIAEVSSDSIDVPDIDEPLMGREALLRGLSVAVLRNPNRGPWSSTVDGEVVDERPDENVLLKEYLEDTGRFKEVALIDSPVGCSQDFILSVSVDCIYNIELDGKIYLWNCVTLGLGFLIGWPYQDSSAFYVAEAVFYDNRGETPVVVSGSLAINEKEWFCDNMWWRPSFYGDWALEPLFDQVLYDFVTRSGWEAP